MEGEEELAGLVFDFTCLNFLDHFLYNLKGVVCMRGDWMIEIEYSLYRTLIFHQ